LEKEKENCMIWYGKEKHNLNFFYPDFSRTNF